MISDLEHVNQRTISPIGAELAQLVRWMTETGGPGSNLATAIYQTLTFA